MSKKPFDISEIQVEDPSKPGLGFGAGASAFKTPVDPIENWKLALSGKTPYWVPFYTESQSLDPRIIPENVCRAWVHDAEAPMDKSEYGGVGWFGTHWIYEELVNGSMPDPKQTTLEDINDWEKLPWPDIDSYDWEASAEANKNYFDHRYICKMTIFNGYWERLIDLMDTAEAAMALVDEDCEDAINAFFAKLTDLYIKEIGYFKKYYNLDCVWFHDDWGTQNGQFFSVETARELFAPHIKRLVDYAHSIGVWVEFHSCGLNEAKVPVMIEIGFDMWNGQPMNDKLKMAQMYGDKILICVDAPTISADEDEEKVVQIAHEFWEQIKDVRCGINSRAAAHPAFAREIYRLSREYYADKD